MTHYLLVYIPWNKCDLHNLSSHSHKKNCLCSLLCWLKIQFVFIFSNCFASMFLMSMTVVTLEEQKISVCFLGSSVKGSQCFHYYRTAIEMKITKYLFRMLKKGNKKKNFGKYPTDHIQSFRNCQSRVSPVSIYSCSCFVVSSNFTWFLLLLIQKDPPLPSEMCNSY